MNATAASRDWETESIDATGQYEKQKDVPRSCPATDEGALAGTGAGDPEVRTPAQPTKRIVVGPVQPERVRFPYDYRLESKKETIRKANEEIGW